MIEAEKDEDEDDEEEEEEDGEKEEEPGEMAWVKWYGDNQLSQVSGVFKSDVITFCLKIDLG